MRVLLTGGTGMVGRNIKEHQSACKYCVLSPTRKELDLTNREQIRSYLKANSPEYIIHAWTVESQLSLGIYKLPSGRVGRAGGAYTFPKHEALVKCGTTLCMLQ